jgi:hypothetical protein
VPCVPGSEGALPEDPKEAIKAARAIGYPEVPPANCRLDVGPDRMPIS